MCVDGQLRWVNARRHGTGTCYAVTTDQTGCQGPCSLSIFDIHTVRRIFGVSRTAGYDLTRSAGFPPPIVISSRCLRWPVEDTLAYRDGLSAASRPGAASPPRRCPDAHPFPGLCSLDVFDAHDVARRFGVSTRTAYRLARTPGFPSPFVLSLRCLRWPAVSVLRYRDSLTADLQPAWAGQR